MTQEEKARNYDEAYKKVAIRFGSNVADEIFSQFEMSEDERIRNFLISKMKEVGNVWKEYSAKDIIAWLEKRPSLLTKEKALKNSPFVEQKTADKKGMNLVEEEMTPFQKEVFCIIDTTIEEEQGLKQVCDKLFALASNEIEQKLAHIDYVSEIREELLSIEDNAKNINGLTESQWVAIRAAHRLLGEYITKEQKPAWSEEDEEMLKTAITSCEQYGNEYAYYWLKSLKDRVFPQTKQEWSEEDEEMYKVRSEKYEKYGQC